MTQASPTQASSDNASRPGSQPAVETPPVSAAEAERAAAAEDRRAAEAKAKAEHAKQIAKQAKAMAKKADAEAVKAAAEAERLRALNRPSKPSDRPSIAEAKANLLHASEKIHPLQDLHATVRAHPFETVGIAAGSGALLGATGNTLGRAIGGGLRLSLVLLKFATPALLAAGKFAAAQAVARKTAGHPAADPVATEGFDPSYSPAPHEAV